MLHEKTLWTETEGEKLKKQLYEKKEFVKQYTEKNPRVRTSH